MLCSPMEPAQFIDNLALACSVCMTYCNMRSTVCHAQTACKCQIVKKLKQANIIKQCTLCCRTWKKILPIIFDVFTSDILNLGFCLNAMSTLGFGFTSYSIIGSLSNFRLQNCRMANNKRHH